MPVQMLSLSAPNGKVSECADTQDLKGGCDSGGEGKGGPVHSEEKGFGEYPPRRWQACGLGF